MRYLSIVCLFCWCSAQAAVIELSQDTMDEAFTLAGPQAGIPQTGADQALPEWITARNRHVTANEYARIRDKLAICERCHSAELHTANSYLPILQGQNQSYLLAKIRFFRSNKRSFHPLRAISEALSDQEISDISRFYAGQSSPLGKTLLSANAANTTESGLSPLLHACSDCHGREGNGANLVPAISGQNENYLGYRIREISNNDSRVHLRSLAQVDCHIPAVGLAGSKVLARRLSMVVDPVRAQRGKTVYQHNCGRCHDAGEQGAPILSDQQDWQQRIRQGTRELVRNALLGKRNMPARGGNARLSRNQLLDAIHFMIDTIDAGNP